MLNVVIVVFQFFHNPVHLCEVNYTFRPSTIITGVLVDNRYQILNKLLFLLSCISYIETSSTMLYNF